VKRADTVLVGRQREIEELLSGLEDAEAGSGRLFVIEGEPGIGKTRIAQELAALAHQRATLVLWSRCWKAAGAPVFWPWIQLVRSCLARVVGDDFYSLVDSAIADIAQILPGSCDQVAPAARAPLPRDPEQVRFRLFEAIAALFKTAATIKPVVLVLDDLGSADYPSLLLLKFLASELHESRIFIVATYRDSEVRSSPSLSEAMGGLVREASLLKLSGLSVEEVADMIGADHHAETAAALHRASGGNPFLLQSILKVTPLESLTGMEQGPGPTRLRFASSLRSAIEGHLAPLSLGARAMLSAAAVIGRDFDAYVLARTLKTSFAELLESLRQAHNAGLITETADVTGENYVFVHSLVRDSLYDAIDVAERKRLHNRVAESIEELYADELDAHLTDLAYHFFEGGSPAAASRAFEYAERAGERAAELGAFEEAARCYQMALLAMKTAGRLDSYHRCELLLAMGEAQNRCADYFAARDSFSQASELGARLHDSTLMARAALGYPGFQWGASSAANEEAIRLLERALRTFPKRDDPWRATLMARLASELYYHPGAAQRRTQLADEAVAMARRTSDDHALLAILGHRDLTLSGPDSLEERFRNAEEMTEIAEKVESYLGLYMGFVSRNIYFRHIGEIAKAEAEAEAMGLLARMTRLPVCSWGAQCFRAARTLLQGGFDEGERLARECLKFAERMRGAEAADLFWPAMILPLQERNRLSEIEPLAARSVDQRPSSAAHRAMFALLVAGTGNLGRARAEFESLARSRFTDIPHDNAFLACTTALAELCADLGDARRANDLLQVLRPYEDLNAVFGPLVSFGSVSRYLGRLAVTAARMSEAEEYFEKALAMNYRIDARTYLAYTRLDFAQMLLARGSQRDRGRALELLSLAREAAEAFKMQALSARLDRIEQDVLQPGGTESRALMAPATPNALAIAPPSDTGTAAARTDHAGTFDGILDREAEFLGHAKTANGNRGRAIFRRDGDYWTIWYDSKVFHLKHVKGLTCLAYLLGHPSTEIHSANLAMVMERANGAFDGAAARPAVFADAQLGDSGPMLDSQAKAEYRRRLLDLREELEEAKRNNDFGRATRAEEEIDFITAEFSRAVGLGGRNRHAGSPSERARLSVTKAIKSVLAKIAQHNSELADHLDATIRTGTFCSYKPDPNSPIFWKVG
jgi:tetratricopeptide (TPR) repeat protein